MEINKDKKNNIICGKKPLLMHMFGSHILLETCMLILIAGFAFYVNRDIVIKGLYMDDLYMWSCYGEQSLPEFAFPIGTSTRFRPVYWLATYLQMAVIGTHINRFVTFNIIINIFVAYELFFMSKRLSKGLRLTALITALCYLASRFAYYQIGQALGLMETMALSMSLLVLYLLLRACGLVPLCDNSKNSIPYFNRRCFHGALTVYFLLVFVHERYISLLPLFYLALIIDLFSRSRLEKSREKGKPASWISPIIVLGLIIAIRTFAIGKAIPAGTGGTEVTETFSMAQTVRFCFDQLLYILGVNAGPEYLCGLSWTDTPWQIKRAIKFSILFIGLFCIIFVIIFIKRFAAALRDSKVSRDRLSEKSKTAFRQIFNDISVCLMICGFAALCIGCSSVTIRLEMRWIYVSYAAAMLLVSYMAGTLHLSCRNKEKEASWCEDTGEGLTAERAVKIIQAMLLTAYAVLTVYTNIFYRGYFSRIYFWQDQLRMNSLAEETVEKYGADYVFGKNIYIIENSYRMSDFYAETFFKPYDPEKRAEGTRVIFADNIADIPAEEIRENKALVLIELPEENAYKDITDEMR